MGWGGSPSSLALMSTVITMSAMNKWKYLVICLHGCFSRLPLLPDPEPLGLYLAVSGAAFSQLDSQVSRGFCVLTIDSEAPGSAA